VNPDFSNISFEKSAATSNQQPVTSEKQDFIESKFLLFTLNHFSP